MVVLYFYGSRKGDMSSKPAATHQEHSSSDGMNPESEIETLDFTSYSKEMQDKLDGPDRKKAQTLTDKATTENTAVAYKDVAEFWEKKKELNMAANYYKKAAFLENTEKSVTFAGNLFQALMQKTEKPEIRKWQALEASWHAKNDARPWSNAERDLALRFFRHYAECFHLHDAIKESQMKKKFHPHAMAEQTQQALARKGELVKLVDELATSRVTRELLHAIQKQGENFPANQSPAATIAYIGSVAKASLDAYRSHQKAAPSVYPMWLQADDTSQLIAMIERYPDEVAARIDQRQNQARQ